MFTKRCNGVNGIPGGTDANLHRNIVSSNPVSNKKPGINNSLKVSYRIFLKNMHK